MGDFDQIGHRIETKDELRAIVIPTIEVLRQREVCIAAKKDFPEACFATTVGGQVEIERRVLVAWPIATTVDDEQRFASVGQRDDQRMVAPLTFVVDADALLLFARRFDLCAVTFNNNFFLYLF